MAMEAMVTSRPSATSDATVSSAELVDGSTDAPADHRAEAAVDVRIGPALLGLPPTHIARRYRMPMFEVVSLVK
jgi:hypothetical protein